MIANRFDYFPQHRHPVPHPHEYIEPPPGPELPLNTSLSEQEYFAQFSQSIPPALLPRHLTESSPTHYAIDAGPSQHASSSQLEPQYPSTEAARELAARARAAHERGRARRTTNPPPFPLASGSHPITTTPLAGPTVPPPRTPPSEALQIAHASSPDPEVQDPDEKRSRNTLASAKFRARRKQHVNKLQSQITDLEGTQGELTREVSELKSENEFLREMMQLKYGFNVKEKPSAP
ncbi:MAG: hypothetical protein TREMPRED_001009 [Tremellales sp. Tagirdzhanova-0007]|nr:MAG: hypothetical protein TREMPRED_001009 [Tremellales sp. Tagirdzhanova-0007]